jgi:hypothetical protein
MSRLLLGICGLLLLTANVSYAQTFNPNVYYQIQPHHSGKCLDVRNVSVSNGGQLQQWDCAAFAQQNQLWTVVPTGTGTFRIVSANSAKCADVINASTTNGTYVQQYDCNLSWAQYNQSFNVFGSPNAGYWRVTPSNAPGTKCLDVEGVSTSNGANIQIWDCGSPANTNQDWSFVPYIPRQPLTNVQEFGYHFSGGVSTWANVSDHGNLVNMYPGHLSEDLANAVSTGLKIKVDLGFHVLAPKMNNSIFSYSSSQGGLNSNYQAIWSSVKAQIGPPNGLYASAVGIFYLDDEPMWRLQEFGFSHDDVHQMLSLTSSMIKADYPNIPIVVNEGWAPIAAGMTYPSTIDWIGFDEYGCEYGGCEPNTPYMVVHNTLKANLLPNQKIVLTPWGSIERAASNGSVATTQAEQDTLAGRADFYINLALSEPRCVGLMVFTGQTQQFPDDNKTLIGTWDMPSVHAKWRFLMRALGFGTP